MAVSDAAPVRINDRLYREVREGRAIILAPYRESTKSQDGTTSSIRPRNNDEGDQAVFYNPIQQYNRDLSVLAILTFGESAIEVKSAKHLKNLDRSKANKKRQKNKQKGVSAPSASDKVDQNGQKPDTDSAIVDGQDGSKPGQNGDAATNGSSEVDQGAVSSRKRSADEANLDNGDGQDGSKRAKNQEKDSLGDVVVHESGDAATRQAIVHDHATTTNNGNTSSVTPRAPRPPPFAILDALSASGLRAVRYAKEIPFATTVVANDLLPEAVDAIKLNIEHNKLEDKVFPNVGDARQYMYSKTGDEAQHKEPGYVHKFDVVDLDPYGTAAPFLDSALQALTDGGLLCVTCTDAGVWASNGYPEKAFALYNGSTLKGPQSHEGGLRLILHSVASTAAKYGIAIEPLLSLSIDFYARLFIRVHKSQQDVKCLLGTTMLVYNCDQGCGAWETVPLGRNQKMTGKKGDGYFKHSYSQVPNAEKHCEHCGSVQHIGGPMWAGPLHHPVFVQKILDRLPDLDKTVYGTTERIRGMLTVALEEEQLNWSPENPHNGTKKLTTTAAQKPSNQANDPASTLPSATAIIPRLPPDLLSPAPFFFLPTYLSKVISIMTPAEDPFRGAFLGLGYWCSRSHCKPGSFKTNAPWSVIWEVMRAWVLQRDSDRIPRLLGEGDFVDKRSVKKDSAGYVILKKLKGRSSNSLAVTRLRESLRQKLGFGRTAVDIESPADLADLLKTTLYELEHPRTSHDSLRTDHGESESESRNGNADEAPVNGGSPATKPLKISGKALIDQGGDPSELEITFDESLGKEFRKFKGDKLVRYQTNPRANWGPMNRAGTT